MLRSMLLVSLVAVLAAPAVATAAPIQVTLPNAGPPQLTLTADGGDDNVDLTAATASQSGTTIELESSSQFATALPNCTLSAGNTVVTCTDVDPLLYAFLGAGSDRFFVVTPAAGVRVAVFGQGGPDDVTGGNGGDFLFGGADNDVVEGRGGDDEMDGYVGMNNPTAGADAEDVLIGGTGADVMYDTGATAHDRIQYPADLGRTAGVAVTFDGRANDGNAAYDASAVDALGGLDAIGVGIDDVNGTAFDDVLTGDAQKNGLFGNAGEDTITGGDGHDELTGGSGDDTLNARDSDDDTADVKIDCGDGPVAGSAGDVANVDRADPAPLRCATVNRFAPGAGVTTPPPGVQPGATTERPGGGGPAGRGPLPPGGTPRGTAAELALVKARETRSRARMPRLVGSRVDRARDALRRTGVEARLDVREVAAPRRGMTIGTVVSQSPKAGTRVTADAAGPVGVRLDVVEGPRGKGASCPGAAELRALKGTDLDLVDELLTARGCRKVAVVLKESSTATVPVASSFRTKGATTTVTVSVPTAERRQDLLIVFREGALQRSDLSAFGLDWTLAPQQSAIGAQVVDRAGRLVRGARLTFDLSGVGGRATQTAETNDRGEIGLGGASAASVLVSRPGVIRVLAQATGRDNQTLWGGAQLRVAARGQAEWPTTVGRRYQGATCRVGVRDAERGGGCVTHWLGSQQVLDEEYGGFVRRGPEVPAGDSATYERLLGVLRDALSFDGGATRLLASRATSPVNRLRTLATDPRYVWQPAQLALSGDTPLIASPGPPVFAKGRLWALKGTKTQEYFDEQMLLGAGGVLVASRSGSWATAGGRGRSSGAPGEVVDAAKATVVRFPDGTGVLSSGDTPPSAGAAGAVALFGAR